MKNLKFLFTGLILLGMLHSCEDEGDMPVREELSGNEITQLQYLIEEEKLARDVYNYLFEIHDLFIFNNIAGSEQKHMYFVQEIMEKYNLENPVIDKPGYFTNGEIQVLYNSLISIGETSIKDALIVGATIEDLDIYDLEEAYLGTSNTDLQSLYQKLTCGSRNHIRAFSGQLDNLGETYEPQYISNESYSLIIVGSHESCDSF